MIGFPLSILKAIPLLVEESADLKRNQGLIDSPAEFGQVGVAVGME